MVGGHLDSWHASDGAVDNGAGVAVSMIKTVMLTIPLLRLKVLIKALKLLWWGGI